MVCNVNYIILTDTTLLSKKEYSSWLEIQNEFYYTYKANLGPWTYEELINYFEDDFKDEENWPFSREEIKDFFEGSELVIIKRY